MSADKPLSTRLSQFLAALVTGAFNSLLFGLFLVPPLLVYCAWTHPVLVIPPTLAYCLLRYVCLVHYDSLAQSRGWLQAAV